MYAAEQCAFGLPIPFLSLQAAVDHGQWWWGGKPLILFPRTLRAELSCHAMPCHATVLLCCHTVYRMGVYACMYGRQHLCHCFFGEAGSLHVSDVLCLCEWERAPGQINLWTQQCQDHGERGVCSLEACMFSAPPPFNFLSIPSSCVLAWLRSDIPNPCISACRRSIWKCSSFHFRMCVGS